MAIAYGSKVSGKAVTIRVDSINVTGPSADTSYKLIVPSGCEGYLDIGNCFTVVTTAIVNTTTPATVVIKKGTTVIGTATCVDGSAVGTTFMFTPAAGYEMGVRLAAGEFITVGWTQGAGGTLSGVVDAYVRLELSSLER